MRFWMDGRQHPRPTVFLVQAEAEATSRAVGPADIIRDYNNCFRAVARCAPFCTRSSGHAFQLRYTPQSACAAPCTACACIAALPCDAQHGAAGVPAALLALVVCRLPFCCCSSMPLSISRGRQDNIQVGMGALECNAASPADQQERGGYSGK